ncbi:unnamed protein product [Rotaria socialis]|uniref:AB hydrolase-1 domain-containing protein n=1 Tax=Rotaria socialis TaxID=392032 RepID=A0A818IUK2_9BILA|nr:unnamed protein product [Rotaria socialis]CAF4693599.1 unnamed protein product [Rotaria socialis]
MHQIFTFILFIVFIPQGYYGQTTPFNATNYARTHRCVWSACNVSGYPSSFLGYAVDCCVLGVPLNYAQPGRTISSAMTRLRPIQASNQTNVLFILSGGPGESGWNLFYTAMYSIPASAGITIILPDHRGTGLSTALSCDNNGSQNISVACIKYLLSKWGTHGLDQFSITAAAHDLSVQIQSYQADYTGRVGVFAVSYGTLWLDRFLQIYPNVVQSAVMDGVFNPIITSDSRTDPLTNSVGEDFLDHCQLQPSCSQFFSTEEPTNPATVVSSDLPVLLHSQVLNYHITQSETWLAVNESEITAQTFNHWHNSTIISRKYPSNYFALRAPWPKYPLDQYYGQYAKNSQVLMLSGQLDPSTVFQQASCLAAITTKTRKFYAIPLAGHVTVDMAQVSYLCPLTLTLSWLFPALFPPSWSDTQCI